MMQCSKAASKRTTKVCLTWFFNKNFGTLKTNFFFSTAKLFLCKTFLKKHTFYAFNFICVLQGGQNHIFPNSWKFYVLISTIFCLDLTYCIQYFFFILYFTYFSQIECNVRIPRSNQQDSRNLSNFYVAMLV